MGSDDLVATTPRGACVSTMSGSVAAISSPVAVYASSLAWRHAPAVAVGRVRTQSERVGVRSRFAIVAKRSAKQRQSRKLEKRDDLRDMQKRMEEREAALEAAAKFRPEPPPPPENPTVASERIEARLVMFREALEKVGEEKKTARESVAWDPTRGYKPFDDVQDAVYELACCRTELFEAYLERAVSLLCQAKSEPPSSLAKFDWVYGKGLDFEKNARTLSFMLAALSKNNVASGMVEVLRAACEGNAVHKFDKKVFEKAMTTLEDLNEMGLLDAGEPEIVAKARETFLVHEETNE